MAEAISSTGSVAAGAQLLATVQARQAQDPTVADGAAGGGATAPAPGAASAGPGQTGPDAARTVQGQAGPAAKADAQDRAKVLGQAVKSLQDYIKPQQTITLQVDKESGEPYLKIVDSQTKQLILQIPSAQVLAMARKLQEMAYPQATTGGLVDEQG
jgi:flagellar protein FlaG